MTANMHEATMRNARYASHIRELAERFHVRLQVRNIEPDDAGAGYVVIHCRCCGAKNRLPRAGQVRCGRCKQDFGRQIVTRAVMIAPVIDETTYAVALHELGHCLHPTGNLHNEMSASKRATGQNATMRDVKLELTEEESAWAWAHQHALEWTPVMTSVETYAMGTYRAGARRVGVK